jgi:hypothetical protein
MKTGTALPVQPQVTLRDADQNIVFNATGQIEVRLANPRTAGDLSEGSESAQVINGIADFEGLNSIVLIGKPEQLGVAAEDYNLIFSYNGIDSEESEVLNVTNADAEKLFIKTAPANGVSRSPFATKAVVHVLDRFDNIVESGIGSNFTIRAFSLDGGTTITGNEEPAVAGVARFEILALGGKVNTNYTISFEAEEDENIGLVSASNVAVTHGTAAKIEFVTPPSSLVTDPSSQDYGFWTRTGDLLATKAVIEVQDLDGNRVLTSNRRITATLSKPSGALNAKDRLESNEVNAVNGRATFDDLRVIARPGDSYFLEFNSRGDFTAIQSGVLKFRHGEARLLAFVEGGQRRLGPVLLDDGVNGGGTNGVRHGERAEVGPCVVKRVGWCEGCHGLTLPAESFKDFAGAVDVVDDAGLVVGVEHLCSLLCCRRCRAKQAEPKRERSGCDSANKAGCSACGRCERFGSARQPAGHVGKEIASLVLGRLRI